MSTVDWLLVCLIVITVIGQVTLYTLINRVTEILNRIRTGK